MGVQKATEIFYTSVKKHTSLCSYIVVASARSTKHAYALSDMVIELCEDSSLPLAHREGDSSSEWILIDAGSIIVHVMTPEMRALYCLEKLWH